MKISLIDKQSHMHIGTFTFTAVPQKGDTIVIPNPVSGPQLNHYTVDQVVYTPTNSLSYLQNV